MLTCFISVPLLYTDDVVTVSTEKLLISKAELKIESILKSFKDWFFKKCLFASHIFLTPSKFVLIWSFLFKFWIAFSFLYKESFFLMFRAFWFYLSKFNRLRILWKWIDVYIYIKIFNLFIGSSKFIKV